MKMRQKLKEYSQPTATKIIPTTTAQVRFFDKQTEAMAPAKKSGLSLIDHNIGATLKIAAMLLASWIKSKNQASGEFRFLLPGTKTYLAYNPEAKTAAIYDDVCTIHHTPDMPSNSQFPNPTDPRVASMIFCLLSETFDGNIEDAIPSLKFDKLEQPLDEGARKEFMKIMTVGTGNESLPMHVLYALTAKGMDTVQQLISALEKAHLKHKGAIIPLDKEVKDAAEKGLEIPKRFTY